MAVPPRIDARLERLEDLLAQLEGFRGRGRAAYEKEAEVRLATQHALQLAIQICIDVAAYLLAAAGRPAPDRYQDLFTDLRPEGLDERLAGGLAQAAGLRNTSSTTTSRSTTRSSGAPSTTSTTFEASPPT
jgi:uncharacterized protein YutE (UPF0331/DUF86 family)